MLRPVASRCSYVSRLAPGDPLVSYYGDRAEKLTPAGRARRRRKARPRRAYSSRQYVRWAAETPCVGISASRISTKCPRGEVIASQRGQLRCASRRHRLCAYVFHRSRCCSAILCAQRKRTLFDRAVCKLGTITSCIPEFWLLLHAHSDLRHRACACCRAPGAYSIGTGKITSPTAPRTSSCRLTVVVLGHLWYYAYMVRNRLLDEMRDGLCAARQGQGPTRRAENPLPPLPAKHRCRRTLSIMAISVPHVLGGTYIVESCLLLPRPRHAEPTRARDTRTTTC